MMNTQEIQFPRKLTQQLLHLAQLSPEQEVCGLVSAKDGVPCRCYPIRNVAEQPDVRFMLDSQQQIDAMCVMRDNGENLFAIYHSHPSAPAVPSAADLKMTCYPEALRLIISLNTEGVLELRGFKIGQTWQEVILSLAEV